MKGGDRKDFFMITIKDLKKQLEKTIQDAFVIKNDKIILKDDLTIGDIMNLKSVESTINNILVVAQTCAFAEQIGEFDIKKNNIANPNETGFDVNYPQGRVLAELKATVPCDEYKKTNKKKYGSNQANSILTDLKNLSDGSSKSIKEKIDVRNYDRYMVLIDIDGQREAFDALKKKKEYINDVDKDIKVVYVKPDTPIAQYDEYGWNPNSEN